MLTRKEAFDLLDAPYAQQVIEEIFWLKNVIKGSKSILEIGSCFGRSLRHFADVAEPGAVIRSIDLGTLPDDSTFPGDDISQRLLRVIESLREDGFDADVLFCSSRSDEAIKWARDNGPYDFVFIDGDHTYDGVKADWESYGNMGKYVGFHDIAHKDCGVRRLWEEIKSSGLRTRECVVSPTGIGVVMNRAPSDRLSISLATRHRPGLLVRTVNDTLKNIKLDTTRILICADEDDQATRSVVSKIDDPRVTWSWKPREDSLGGKYNRVLTEAPADAYLVMVDYGAIVTPGFDEKVLESARVYSDGYAFLLNHIVCAVDPNQSNNSTFCQMNGITDKLARALGGIYPEIFPYWFVDHWFEDMSRLIDRRVFVDIVANCTARPGTMDRREPEFWGNVFDWLYLERQRIAHEIVARPDFDETPDRKHAIMRNAPWVHERTFWINSQLRGMPPGDIDDERYLRIRKLAYDMLPNEAKQEEAAAKAEAAA